MAGDEESLPSGSAGAIPMASVACSNQLPLPLRHVCGRFAGVLSVLSSLCDAVARAATVPCEGGRKGQVTNCTLTYIASIGPSKSCDLDRELESSQSGVLTSRVAQRLHRLSFGLLHLPSETSPYIRMVQVPQTSCTRGYEFLLAPGGWRPHTGPLCPPLTSH